MKKILVSIFALCLASNVANAAMSITSPDFKEGQLILEKNVFNGFGCKGENLVPEFTISDVPADAKSLAITMYDPDAPTGSGWWHWIVYNIDPSTKTVKSDAMKTKTATFGKNVSFGKTDFGTYNYGGPCPPVGHGKHHYILAVYALKTDKINVPGDATAAMIGFNIKANTIERASITAIYQR